MPIVEKRTAKNFMSLMTKENSDTESVWKENLASQDKTASPFRLWASGLEQFVELACCRQMVLLSDCSDEVIEEVL